MPGLLAGCLAKMSYRWQIGQFLIYMGLIALILFFITDQVNNPYYLVFCAGVLIIFLGVTIMWRYRSPVQPSGRFRLLRRNSEDKQRGKKDERGLE